MAFIFGRSTVSRARRQTPAAPRPEALVSFLRGALTLPNQMVMLLCLALVDALALQLSLYLGVGLYNLAMSGVLGQQPATLDLRLVLCVLLMPAGYHVLGVYRVCGQAPIERFPRRVKATCLLFALLASWHYAGEHTHWPIGAAGLTVLLALVLPLASESIVRVALSPRGRWGIPTVVIGAGPTGRRVVRILKQMPELGLRPVALFDDHPDSWGAVFDDVPVLGSISDGVKYGDGTETVIVSTPAQSQETVGAIAMRLRHRDIIIVPELADLQTLWVRARDLNGFIGLQMRRNLLVRRNRLMKQTVDYLIALPIFLLSVPVIGILALWIVMESAGAPFYAQLRPGKDERPIKVWKLRTMYPDAEARLEEYLAENPVAREEWQRYCKLTNDPRILPRVGTFLRRTSLDELPQIYNVMRGEMSLVGPRPFPKYHLDHFDVAFQKLRASVIPGITGLWQVSARSDADLEMQQALDTYYIRNWSIWMDAYILFRTVSAVVAGRGAR